jgi:hypothetical protein
MKQPLTRAGATGKLFAVIVGLLVEVLGLLGALSILYFPETQNELVTFLIGFVIGIIGAVLSWTFSNRLKRVRVVIGLPFFVFGLLMAVVAPVDLVYIAVAFSCILGGGFFAHSPSARQVRRY